MTDKTIKKNPKILRLSVLKAIIFANEKILRIVYDLVSHKGSNVWVGWIKINFQILALNKNKTNVRPSVTDEILTSNSKNIGSNVKKGAILGVERKSKVVHKLIEKNYVDCFLKSTKNSIGRNSL